jgi:hypothetical protein
VSGWSGHRSRSRSARVCSFKGIASAARPASWLAATLTMTARSVICGFECLFESCNATLLYMVGLTVILILLTGLLALLTGLQVQQPPPWLISLLTRARDACHPGIPSEWTWQQLDEEDGELYEEDGELDEEDDEDDIEPDPADEALAAQRKASAAESAATDKQLQALDDQINANYVQLRILEEIARGNLLADAWGAAWPTRPAEAHAERLALKPRPRHARAPAGPST